MPHLPAIVVLALCLSLASAVAIAAPPPQDALPLSQIVRMLEERLSPAYFDEIEWDDDGYWEIEYVGRDGTKRKVKVDPITGQDRSGR